MKLYFYLVILCLIVAGIGLVSFCGGMRGTNLGVFVFPLLLALLFWHLSRKK